MTQIDSQDTDPAPEDDIIRHNYKGKIRRGLGKMPASIFIKELEPFPQIASGNVARLVVAELELWEGFDDHNARALFEFTVQDAQDDEVIVKIDGIPVPSHCNSEFQSMEQCSKLARKCKPCERTFPGTVST